MALGRPTSYKKEYCQLIIEHCSKGKSLKSFACSIDVHVTSLYDWEKQHPDFSYALEKARQLAEIWWENIATEAVSDKRKFINTELFKYMTKVRFRWSEPQEIKIEDANASAELEKYKDLYKKLLDVKSSG